MRPSVPGMTSDERRSAVRRKLEVEVSLTSESNFFAGLSGDVSSGGIFVSTYELRPVGTKLDLVFSLAETVIEARGTVRWVQEPREDVSPGMGVKFDQLAEHDRRKIEAFCQERAPLYFDVDESVEARR